MVEQPKLRNRTVQPKRLTDRHLEQLDIPFYEDEDNAPEGTMFLRSDPVSGLLVSYRVKEENRSPGGRKIIDMGVEPSVITEGLFPELLG